MTNTDYAMGWLVLIRPELIRYFDFEEVDVAHFLYLCDLWNERVERNAALAATGQAVGCKPG